MWMLKLLQADHFYWVIIVNNFKLPTKPSLALHRKEQKHMRNTL